jgi:hypothetical protein
LKLEAWGRLNRKAKHALFTVDATFIALDNHDIFTSSLSSCKVDIKGLENC